MNRFFSLCVQLFVAWLTICFSQLLFADDSVFQFTESDISYLQQFSISNLPPPTSSISNRVADDLIAAHLGQQLFFDTRLSANNKVACATCHQPQHYFTDGLAVAVGLQQGTRNTPSILGAAYGPWKYWDGRKDSLWSQALEPIQSAHEQGLTPLEFAERVLKFYPEDYNKVFNKQTMPLTETSALEVYVNSGKALMAYQRQLSLPKAPLDQFVDALANHASTKQLKKILTEEQVTGLRLFVGKAGCVSCHNGPLLTNFEFHNIGAPELNTQQVDLGRYSGIEKLRADDFTCLSLWSDADSRDCLEMQYLKQQGPELVGAFKTPSLRNVAATAPYMHAGQFKTLTDVVNHYNKPTPPVFIRDQHPSRPHFDILPLNLSDEEKLALVAFLETLTSPIPTKNTWWTKH